MMTVLIGFVPALAGIFRLPTLEDLVVWTAVGRGLRRMGAAAAALGFAPGGRPARRRFPKE